MTETARPATVAALRRGLELLDLFSADEPVLGVTEMARRLGLHKSSASRLAATLSSAGYLRPAGGNGGYRLGGKLARLGSLAGEHAGLDEAGAPILAELVQAHGETGHIAVLDGIESVTTTVVDGWRSVRMHSRVGKRSPAHATAIGKVLLAGLGDAEVASRYAGVAPATPTATTNSSLDELRVALAAVREAGWAFDEEELEPGLRCVAAPVRDHAGSIVGAVGVSGPATRITASTRTALAADVRRCADAISAALGAPA